METRTYFGSKVTKNGHIWMLLGTELVYAGLAEGRTLPKVGDTVTVQVREHQGKAMLDVIW